MPSKDSMPLCPIFWKALKEILHSHLTGRYRDLLNSAVQIKEVLQQHHGITGVEGGNGPRFAIMAPPGPSYVEASLGSWLAGGIAVPLCLSHPQEELQYVLENSGAKAVLATQDCMDRILPLAKKQRIGHYTLGNKESISQGDNAVEQVNEAAKQLIDGAGSLIIYTSGTTGKPKGALHTFGSLDAQIRGLCSSWQWRSADRILHTLPLHHIHGIVNALFCPLAVGATIEFRPKFSPAQVWQALMRKQDPVTVFMGVPTMYTYLLSHFDKMSASEQSEAKEAASRLRLTVSGSAACPVPVMQKWEKLSGQRLLERYGMTETGMILSNPYEGARKPGTVGFPLPGVQVQLLDEGELAVKGKNLFKEYWEKPEATRDSFTADGYFMTGDTASADKEGYWKILGRTSTDIIKCGGYKLSALQIEDVLLDHPEVAECVVLGIPDEAKGEAVTAVITCNEGKVDLEQLQKFAEKRLAHYQLPTELKVLDEMPRNPMGKVNKKALRKELYPDKFDKF